MNKEPLLAMILVMLLTLSADNANAGKNISLMYGTNTLDKSDWPAESQTAYGFGIVVHETAWPAALVITYLNGHSKETGMIFGGRYEFLGDTTEIGVGARAYALENSSLRIFLEGGLANISAKSRVEISGFPTESDSGSAYGIWFGAGLDVNLNRKWSAGINARISRADVELGPNTVKAGGNRVNLFAAYHFE